MVVAAEYRHLSDLQDLNRPLSFSSHAPAELSMSSCATSASSLTSAPLPMGHCRHGRCSRIQCVLANFLETNVHHLSRADRLSGAG